MKSLEGGNLRNARSWRPQGIRRQRNGLTATSSLRLHWPEYLMEAGELSLYMLSVCALATLLQHRAPPVPQLIASNSSRRALMGLAIGTTVIAIVMSPWGKQSGGHFNPAINFTFYRLGNVAPWDVLYYVIAQFVGAISGVASATFVLQGAPANRAVRYAETVPGVYGSAAAFAGELTISFIQSGLDHGQSGPAGHTGVFLATDHASFIQGAQLAVDGGRTAI